jgi:hypothetical protein
MRGKNHTSFAAACATSAELSRRGYDVAFTLGNTPRVDLICAVPDGEAFKVQVKGISTANGFYCQKEFFDAAQQQNLFLIIVLVPPVGDSSPFRFFVLSHEEAILEFSRMPKFKRDGRPYENGSGLNWGSVKPYEDSWDKLPRIFSEPQESPSIGVT